MGNTQRAAVATRISIVAAVTGVLGDSLDQLNPAKLPNGALIVIATTGAVYRYSLTSTATASTPLGNVILPATGVGRFIYVSGGSVDPRSVQVTGTASLTGATAETDDTWIATPSGTGFYIGTTTVSMPISTTTGIITYVGPTQQYKVTLSATLASAVAAQSLELAISVDGAFIGTTTALNDSAVANVPPTTAGLAISMTTQRLVTLVSGQTLQAIMRDTSASNNITLSKLNLIATAA
jgi:hypothetical protein